MCDYEPPTSGKSVSTNVCACALIASTRAPTIAMSDSMMLCFCSRSSTPIRCLPYSSDCRFTCQTQYTTLSLPLQRTNTAQVVSTCGDSYVLSMPCHLMMMMMLTTRWCQQHCLLTTIQPHATDNLTINTSNLDFVNPVQYVQHLLENFLQLQREFKTKSASTQQLQQVRPQLENIVFPKHRQSTQFTYNKPYITSTARTCNKYTSWKCYLAIVTNWEYHKLKSNWMHSPQNEWNSIDKTLGMFGGQTHTQPVKDHSWDLCKTDAKIWVTPLEE